MFNVYWYLGMFKFGWNRTSHKWVYYIYIYYELSSLKKKTKCEKDKSY